MSGKVGSNFVLLIFLAASSCLLLLFANSGWGSLTFHEDYGKFLSVLGSLAIVAVFLERGLAVINDVMFPKEQINSLLQSGYQAVEQELVNLNSPDQGIVDQSRAELDRLQGEVAKFETQADEQDDKRRRMRLALGFFVAVLIAGVGVRSLGELVKPPPLTVEKDNGVSDEVDPQQTPPGRDQVPSVVGEPQASATTVPTEVGATTSRTTSTGQTASNQNNAGNAKYSKRTFRNFLFDFLDILLTAGLLAGGSNGIAKLIESVTAPRPSLPSERARLFAGKHR